MDYFLAMSQSHEIDYLCKVFYFDTKKDYYLALYKTGAIPIEF